jgi:hypothetical protein
MFRVHTRQRKLAVFFVPLRADVPSLNIDYIYTDPALSRSLISSVMQVVERHRASAEDLKDSGWRDIKTRPCTCGPAVNVLIKAKDRDP